MIKPEGAKGGNQNGHSKFNLYCQLPNWHRYLVCPFRGIK